MNTSTKTAIDQQLASAIDPWLSHMRWRTDFEKWRNGRLWQENKQQHTLETLQLFMGAAGKPVTIEGLQILDLGCGMGGLSVAMARAGARVQPYDYNPAYCAITRLRGQRYDLALQPVNGGGENLPFPTAHFDLIVCMDVLEHVQRPPDLLAEAARCLKPGGLLYITAINRFAFNDPHYHARFVNWLPRRFANPYLHLTRRHKDNSRFTDRQTLDAMHYYRYPELPRLARRHGFVRTLELGELELAPSNTKLVRLSERKAKLVGLLRKTGLLQPLYRLYRYAYKGTYQLLLVKP